MYHRYFAVHPYFHGADQPNKIFQNLPKNWSIRFVHTIMNHFDKIKIYFMKVHTAVYWSLALITGAEEICTGVVGIGGGVGSRFRGCCALGTKFFCSMDCLDVYLVGSTRAPRASA